MSEQALTNMDDAPDLFEYRRGSTNQLAASGSGKVSSTAQPPVDHQANQELKPKSAREMHNQRQQHYIFNENNPAADSAATTTSTSTGGGGGGGGGATAAIPTNKISTFVHITDIHIDPYYEAGSLNDCNEPLCCRASSGPVALGDKRRQAGRWGDYGNCDTPVRTLRSALERIREQHSDAEYWLWTGDISPHDIWNITKLEAANHVRLVSKMVRDYSNGLPVFPVIGNHEAHPVNR